jgi:flagellar biosynthesis chaperone FliJ
MKPFRFRAAAALDLRRRQEDDARLLHARAEQAARDAAARVANAGAAVDRAVEERTSTEREGMDAWLMTWHRSWITRLRLDVTVQQQHAVASNAAASRAAASVQKAHQRRRTLERLRERGLRRYDTDVQRSELKEMNLLAGLRYVARADEGDSE